MGILMFISMCQALGGAFLIQRYGVAGIAAISATMLITQNVLMMGYVRRKVGIRTFAWYRRQVLQ